MKSKLPTPKTDKFIADQVGVSDETLEFLINMERDLAEAELRLDIVDPDGDSIDMLYDDNGEPICYG